MITKDDALEDLGKIKVDAPIGTVIIEATRILIKLLVTIRSNQLLCEPDKVKIKEAKIKRDIEKK